MSCENTAGQGDGTQNVAASPARLQEIEDSVRLVLEGQQLWLTPEEFLANIETHRRKHDQDRLNPKPIDQKPAEVREYQLKRPVTYNRQMELTLREVVG